MNKFKPVPFKKYFDKALKDFKFKAEYEIINVIVKKRIEKNTSQS